MCNKLTNFSCKKNDIKEKIWHTASSEVENTKMTCALLCLLITLLLHFFQLFLRLFIIVFGGNHLLVHVVHLIL